MNVCPISLLNVISPDQTRGVPGYFIGENVAFLRDLVYYTFESGTPAAILSLDQVKAFDRVDWPFLFRTLSCLQSGQSFISRVQLLYTDICRAILVTGYTTDFFWPSCGVRQGCTLSPMLHIISIKVLAANLRAHPDIVGLRPLGFNCTLPVLSLYPDGTSVMASSFAAIRTVLRAYHVFKRGSGFWLDLSKSGVSGLVHGLSLRPPHQ